MKATHERFVHRLLVDIPKCFQRVASALFVLSSACVDHTHAITVVRIPSSVLAQLRCRCAIETDCCRANARPGFDHPWQDFESLQRFKIIENVYE
jgi:hypothetical protein